MPHLKGMDQRTLLRLNRPLEGTGTSLYPATFFRRAHLVFWRRVRSEQNGEARIAEREH